MLRRHDAADYRRGQPTFIEWSVKLDTAPQDEDRWHALFHSWIPDWTHSLEKRWTARLRDGAAVIVAGLRRPSGARRRKS
jgi:hypothetical protein